MDTQENRPEQRAPLPSSSSVEHTASTFRAFVTTELTQRLDLVRHLVSNSERIPLLSGVTDVGKSTLMGLLYQQAPDNWEIHCIHATPTLQTEQLIDVLCRRFSALMEDLDRVEQLVQKFADLRDAGRTPVLIVDDTEQLPLTTLIDLFGIYSKAYGQHGGLALVLFATPQIDDLLKETRLQFASQRVQPLELFPLHREQSDQFVRYLFKVLAGQRELSVSEEGYEKIYRTSGGLPGKIIRYVEEMLQPETLTPAVLAKRRVFLPQLLSDVSAPVLIGGVILALLLLLTLIYEDEINAVFEPENAPPGENGIESTENRQVIPLQLPDQSIEVERDISARTEQDMQVEIAEETSTSEVTVIQAELPSQPIDVEKSELPPAVIVSLPELTARQTTTDSSESGSPEQQPAVIAKTAVSQIIENDKSTDDTTPVKSVTDPPVSKQETAVTAVTPEEVVLTPTTLQAGDEAKQSSPAPVIELGQAKKPESSNIVPEPITLTRKSEKASPVTVLESAIKREAWLLKQSPDAYTLQLIGLGDEQAVTSFIRRHKLEGNVAYFRTQSNGRPWFPVVYGLYPSHGAAVSARSKLPQELAKQGSWPRSLASIQQAIKGK